jgi:hypothetical protein
MQFEYLEYVSDACIVVNNDEELLFHNPGLLVLGNLKERELKKIKKLSELVTFNELPTNDLSVESDFTFFNSSLGFGQIKKVLLDENSFMLIIKDLSIEKNLQVKFHEQIIELKRLNSNLEKLVELRTHELLTSNHYLSGILNSFNQAIFSVNERGEIDLGTGLNLEILGDKKPLLLADLFQDQMTSDQTLNWLRLLFSTALSFEDMVGVAPEEVTYSSRPFKITYYPMHEKKSDSKSLIVALTNISHELQVRSELGHNQVIASSLLKASKNANRFNEAMEECRGILDSLLDPSLVPSLSVAKLHALKGLFSYYGPEGFDVKVHAIEISHHAVPELIKSIASLQEQFELILAKIKNLLPHLQQGKHLISQNELTLLHNASSMQEVREILMPHRLLDLEELCLSLESYIKEMAAGVSKELNQFSVDCSHYFVEMELFPLINQFLIHGLRNSIAHVFSYQLSEVRQENNVHLAVIQNDESVSLTIMTKGILHPRESKDSVLSGQKQGLILIEQMANYFGCQMSLVLDSQKNQSHFNLLIPIKFIRRISHGEV